MVFMHCRPGSINTLGWNQCQLQNGHHRLAETCPCPTLRILGDSVFLMHRTSTCRQMVDHWVKLLCRTSIRYGSLLPEWPEFPFRESVTIFFTQEAFFFCWFVFHATFYFEVSVHSHAIVRNNTETYTPFDNTLQNDRTLSQPGCWHWYNQGQNVLIIPTVLHVTLLRLHMLPSSLHSSLNPWLPLVCSLLLQFCHLKNIL